MDRTTTATTAAVVELRKHFDEAQYPFAERFGASVRALANYETDRIPPLPMLVQLMKAANSQQRYDLEAVFQTAIEKELNVSIIPERQREDFDALRAILNVKSALYADTRKKWNEISEPVKAASRAKNYRAAVNTELVQTIHQGLADGLTNDQILSKIPKADAESAKAVIESLSKLAQPKGDH